MRDIDREGYHETWIGSTEVEGGWWRISGSLNFSIKKKPSKWSKFWHRVLLGWEWFSMEETNRRMEKGPKRFSGVG